ncbi:uncharacterized protein LACBIDRAFT_305224 [Laccaria bicolor S238N-H82]|uniref:Predicted protein n=1 Tax=Laccaria bicolor (strain S238N-H82 / ATCC MYA-4686) TaxID=486041 RepID=B0CTQ6_LACBS|nr:uncharacterized protein LACBIDRAFT_305224 [Laccaria bicolor S238N-H82]EDR14535.1 predicted protein [Laccaria bicolor S238N-H82]|eukprot:XP_001875094.1 predicted protein [Laccaria bicolor S238N-H82]
MSSWRRSRRRRGGRASATDELRKHVCAALEKQVFAMKLQRYKERKGLMLQIRYLEA